MSGNTTAASSDHHPPVAGNWCAIALPAFSEDRTRTLQAREQRIVFTLPGMNGRTQ